MDLFYRLVNKEEKIAVIGLSLYNGVKRKIS